MSFLARLICVSLGTYNWHLAIASRRRGGRQFMNGPPPLQFAVTVLCDVRVRRGRSVNFPRMIGISRKSNSKISLLIAFRSGRSKFYGMYTYVCVCAKVSAAALPKSDVSRGRKEVNDAAASERIFFRRMQEKKLPMECTYFWSALFCEHS